MKAGYGPAVLFPFYEHGSGSGSRALGFHKHSSGSGALFSQSGFGTLIFSIISVCLKLTEK